MSAVMNSEPSVILRPMLASDLSGVLQVENAAYICPWTENIFRDCMNVAYYCCVLEGEGEIIGHGVMSVAVGECHLLNICIHPDYQRQGLGERMVDHLLSLANHARVRLAYLEVRVSNIVAKSLYLKRGFREIGIRKNYYPGTDEREDAIILVLDMKSDVATDETSSNQHQIHST